LLMPALRDSISRNTSGTASSAAIAALIAMSPRGRRARRAGTAATASVAGRAGAALTGLRPVSQQAGLAHQRDGRGAIAQLGDGDRVRLQLAERGLAGV
jgi:hypothetical protein